MSTTMPTRDLDRLSRSGLTAADLENLDDDLSGRTVYDRQSEEIGTIEDVLVDTRGNIYITDKQWGLFVLRYTGKGEPAPAAK